MIFATRKLRPPTSNAKFESRLVRPALHAGETPEATEFMALRHTPTRSRSLSLSVMQAMANIECAQFVRSNFLFTRIVGDTHTLGKRTKCTQCEPPERELRCCCFRLQTSRCRLIPAFSIRSLRNSPWIPQTSVKLFRRFLSRLV